MHFGCVASNSVDSNQHWYPRSQADFSLVTYNTTVENLNKPKGNKHFTNLYKNHGKSTFQLSLGTLKLVRLECPPNWPFQVETVTSK